MGIIKKNQPSKETGVILETKEREQEEKLDYLIEPYQDFVIEDEE